MISVAPITLQGRFVRLVPLTLEHVDALTAVGLDPAIWEWTPVRVRNREEMRAFVAEALEAQRGGTALPFATMLASDGTIIGSTRFMNIAPEHRRVEIGGTWIAPRWQRTRANTEAKYLMLTHAFERWDCTRVEFKTHALNATSRTAILRLGAVEEGILRNHMIHWDGTARDTVYFSIVDAQWPAVKARLETALA